MLQPCYIIGIDPGVPVTMALLSPEGKWAAHAKPRAPGATKKNDIGKFCDVMKSWKAHADEKGADIVACIETAHPRPREGVVSVGRYVGSYWMARTACAILGIKYYTVAPRVWKGAMGLDDDKAKSIALVKKLFADDDRASWRLKHKKDHDFAEAVLLARYLATASVNTTDKNWS